MEALSLGSDCLLCFDLNHGLVTIVDKERFESTLVYNCRDGRVGEFRPSSLHWFACGSGGYTYVNAKAVIGGRRQLLPLHRLLVEAPAQSVVDHISGDTLDNRLRNLRACSIAENAMNSRKYRRGASMFKGVIKRRGSWLAQFHYRDEGVPRTAYLGSFSTEHEAARAYDARAKQEFGEFARLNFPAAS